MLNLFFHGTVTRNHFKFCCRRGVSVPAPLASRRWFHQSDCPPASPVAPEPPLPPRLLRLQRLHHHHLRCGLHLAHLTVPVDYSVTDLCLLLHRLVIVFQSSGSSATTCYSNFGLCLLLVLIHTL